MTPRRALLLGLAAVAGYVRTFAVPFIWDDLPHIVRNPKITAPEGALDWLHAGTQETRPLLNLSFALDHALYGLDPAGWHATNLLLHVAATIALCGAVGHVLARARPVAVAQRAAFFGALLFAVHPLATEAVTYVNSRSVVAASGAMWAAWWALEAMRSGRAAGKAPTQLRRALPTALLAFGLLWKEMAVTLPAVILLADFLLPPRDATGEPIPLRQRLGDVATLLPAIAVVPLLFVAFRSPHSSHIGFAVLDPVHHAATQPIALGKLLSLCVFPVGQNLDHDLPLAASPFAPATLAAVAAWLLLAFAAWRHRTIDALPLWLLGAFLLAMAPTNSIVPFYDYLCERHVYPGLGVVCVGFGVVIAAAPPRFGNALAIALASVLALLTLQRNELWREPLLLWHDAAVGSPEKARPAAQLGAHLARRKELAAARPWLERAVRQAPEIRPFRENLGLLYRLGGEPERELELWRARLREAPTDADAARTLERLERRMGQSGKGATVAPRGR